MTVTRIGFAYNPTIEAAVELSARATGWCEMRSIDHWQLALGDLERYPVQDMEVVIEDIDVLNAKQNSWPPDKCR